jgi:hypothetical protein
VIKIAAVEYECLQSKTFKWKKLHARVALDCLVEYLAKLSKDENIRKIRVVKS